MNKKKLWYIILSVVAVVLVAVIVFAAIKLNRDPGAGAQSTTGATTAAQNTQTDLPQTTEETGEAGQPTENTEPAGNNAPEGNENPSGGNKPSQDQPEKEPTEKPTEGNDKPGIDFDDLLN